MLFQSPHALLYRVESGVVMLEGVGPVLKADRDNDRTSPTERDYIVCLACKVLNEFPQLLVRLRESYRTIRNLQDSIEQVWATTSYDAQIKSTRELSKQAISITEANLDVLARALQAP